MASGEACAPWGRIPAAASASGGLLQRRRPEDDLRAGQPLRPGRFRLFLDQIGPLTQDVTDCALIMNAIAGADRRDSTSVPEPVPDYTLNLKPV